MPDRAAISPAFQDALDKQDFDRIEELWLESLDRDRIRVDEMLEVRRLIFQAGRKNLAMTLLDLLVDTLESRDDPFQTMAALKEQVRLVGKPDAALLKRLEKALAATRADSPSLDAVVSRYPLSSQKKPVQAIKDIENWLDHDTGTIVEVVGQGVGRVIELNLALDNIKVDLGGRRPVSVPFGAVSKFLRPLPDGDFRRRNVENAEELTAFTHENPGQALVELIESLGENVSVSAIKAGLDGVVTPKGWTSWWNKARKHPRILTSGTGSRLRYSVSESAEDATSVLLTELEEADPRQRLTIAKRLSSRGNEASEEANRILAASIETFDDEPGLAWETAAALGALPGGQEAAVAAQATIIETAQPIHLLGGIQDRQSRMAALEAIREARPDDWTTIWGEWLLHESTPAILDTIATALDRAGATDSLDAAIEAVFRNHVQHATQFIWACERMTNPDSPEPVRRRMTPSLLEKIPDGLSRREFASLRGRCKALLDGGKVAIRLLLESANEGQAQRFSQRIARLPGVEPQRVSLVEQAAHQAHGSNQQEDEGPLLVATQAAIDAQRADLRQLLDVEIPKTLKGINAAAAEGDLRENFEYHMLRDRQELQSARAAKLQKELREVRTLDPGKADTGKVNIGTIVHFEGEVEPLTILGVWDADVDRRVFANGSGLAEALLGHKIGDDAEIEGKIVTIASIEAWQG
jgi:transcription elongation factor GreA